MSTDVLGIVREPQAERDLRRYFAEDTEPLYSGRRFERLAADDRGQARDVFTANDIVAVQMLSVRVPAEVVIGMLDGDLGRKLARLLAQIDTTIELGTAAATDQIVEGSPAFEAWDLLSAEDGIGSTIASKLMARKRPKLIPVYDDVVRCVLGKPKDAWLALHNRLAADGGEVRHELAVVQSRAGVPSAVSVLRALDVICGCVITDNTRAGEGVWGPAPWRCPEHLDATAGNAGPRSRPT